MGNTKRKSKSPSHMCYLLEINPSQWTLLNTMLNKKEKEIISCKELQEELGLDSSYVSRTLSRLMNKGLVSRKYVFVNNSPPRYCYTPLSKEGIQEKVNAKTNHFLLEKYGVNNNFVAKNGIKKGFKNQAASCSPRKTKNTYTPKKTAVK